MERLETEDTTECPLCGEPTEGDPSVSLRVRRRFLAEKGEGAGTSSAITTHRSASPAGSKSPRTGAFGLSVRPASLDCPAVAVALLVLDRVPVVVEEGTPAGLAEVEAS